MRMRLAVMLGLAMCAVATSANAQTPVTYYSCLKPWAIPDKWIDRHDDPDDGVWTAEDTFETVDAYGNPLSDADVYADINMDPAGGTGFKLPRDLGLRLTLKIADPQDGMKSGFFYAVNLGTAGDGANSYRSAIATCQEVPPPHYGDVLQPLTGNLKGPTVQGVADLINLDPNAEWDPVTRTVINSCAPSPACGPVSPRIVTVLAFNPSWYERSWWPHGSPILLVTNIVGVFVDGIVGGKVSGYVTTPPWMNNQQP
jgi:hypothetical protein